MSASTVSSVPVPHSRWVRVSHWIITISFLALAFSGIFILMSHPRLYWGETGNDLTPALIEFPISRNHNHGGWEKPVSFFDKQGSPVSAVRTYEIFNENGWGRSLHFLAAWLLVSAGLLYLVSGILTGHFRKNILPAGSELKPSLLIDDLRNHFRLRIPPATGGPQYGLLQKYSYAGVIFLVLPLMVITGLAMSPAVTASYPFLSSMWGGSQSARTIHFFASAALELFLIGHLLMVILSGFGKQMRGMTTGRL